MTTDNPQLNAKIVALSDAVNSPVQIFLDNGIAVIGTLVSADLNDVILDNSTQTDAKVRGIWHVPPTMISLWVNLDLDALSGRKLIRPV